MSVGAPPNLSGGLWSSGMSDSDISWCNGISDFGQDDGCNNNGNGNGNTCDASGDGGGGGNIYSESSGAAGSMPGMPISSLSCSTPPGGPAPPPPPGVGSTYSQGIAVYGIPGMFGPIEGVPISCAETGVTEPSLCSGGAMFYFTTNSVVHYTTPAGTYSICNGASDAFRAGSASGAPGSVGEIEIHTGS